MTSHPESFNDSFLMLFCPFDTLTMICKYLRGLLPDPLCLSRRNTLELQNPVTQCMFGWRTSVPEALRCASGNSRYLMEYTKIQLW